jgi:hypothetical protein
MSNPDPDPFSASLSPYLTIKGAAAAAIDFYKAAFGAQELYRQPAPDGERVFHASLLINGALVYLSDDFPTIQPVPATRSRSAAPRDDSPAHPRERRRSLGTRRHRRATVVMPLESRNGATATACSRTPSGTGGPWRSQDRRSRASCGTRRAGGCRPTFHTARPATRSRPALLPAQVLRPVPARLRSGLRRP